MIYTTSFHTVLYSYYFFYITGTYNSNILNVKNLYFFPILWLKFPNSLALICLNTASRCSNERKHIIFYSIEWKYAQHILSSPTARCYSPWNVLLSHFCVRSPCVHRSFIMRPSIVHSFAWARVQHSQNVHRSLTVCSVTVHKTFIVLKAFSHFHSELQRERIVLKPSVQNSDKIRRNVCRRMGENVLCILEISLLITMPQDY